MGDELRRHALDEELVPLSVAATVAYFHLTHAITQVGQADVLLRAVALTALAISQVASIHLGGAGDPKRALSAAEVDRLLVQPMLERAPCPDLDRFLIRRGELRRALASLRVAREALA
jgi:hypothetical protein